MLTLSLYHAINATIGVDDLWKHCIPNVKEKPSQNFNIAKNTRISVEISCFLCACDSRLKVELLTCCVLSYVPTDVINFLESNHVSFVKCNIFLYFVFVGCDHLMKAETKASRCNQRKKAKAELFYFYERGKDPTEVLTDKDFTFAMRNMKKITSKTNELIKFDKNWMIEKDLTCMCAPSEVE